MQDTEEIQDDEVVHDYEAVQNIEMVHDEEEIRDDKPMHEFWAPTSGEYEFIYRTDKAKKVRQEYGAKKVVPSNIYKERKMAEFEWPKDDLTKDDIRTIHLSILLYSLITYSYQVQILNTRYLSNDRVI